MSLKLLKDAWTDLDSAELRLFLDERIGGPGQFKDRLKDPNKFYLPLADSSCRIVLTFSEKKIVAIEPGPSFNITQWEKISDEIEKSILAGPVKVGRAYSFSTLRVSGTWRGERSGVQILPPPDDAPRAPVEMADHPFILEFLVKVSDFGRITNHRLMREHRQLTLLLNILLAGRTSFQSRRSQHFWASVSDEGGSTNIKWVQQLYFVKLGNVVIDELSPPAGEQLGEIGARRVL